MCWLHELTEPFYSQWIQLFLPLYPHNYKIIRSTYTHCMYITFHLTMVTARITGVTYWYRATGTFTKPWYIAYTMSMRPVPRETNSRNYIYKQHVTIIIKLHAKMKTVHVHHNRKHKLIACNHNTYCTLKWLTILIEWSSPNGSFWLELVPLRVGSAKKNENSARNQNSATIP